MTWKVIIVNRPGLDILHFDEAPLDRTFPSREAAEQWAIEAYGDFPRDREGWRVEPALRKNGRFPVGDIHKEMRKG